MLCAEDTIGVSQSPEKLRKSMAVIVTVWMVLGVTVLETNLVIMGL